jgi:hypothetical protein
MTPINWTLMTIDMYDGFISPVPLQKILFVLGEECDATHSDDYYDFEPYDYGPFDASVFEDAETLDQNGLIFTDREGWYDTYQVTPTGSRQCESLRDELSSHTTDYHQELVDWAERQSFKGLLRKIFDTYPEYACNSVF